MAVPPVGSGNCEKNRSAGFQPAEGPLKCNDLYAGETPALQFFTLRGMKSLAITSELPHTSKSVTGETPVPRWLRGMAVPPVGSGSCEKIVAPASSRQKAHEKTTKYRAGRGRG